MRNDARLMRHAWVEADYSTCSWLAVGAIVAQDTRIVSSGRNGAAAGQPHCVHVNESPERPRTHAQTLTHAETNAIGYAARKGRVTEGATLYVTHSPCEHCAPVVLAAGIARVVYDIPFRSDAGAQLLRAAGVQVDRRGHDEGENAL